MLGVVRDAVFPWLARVGWFRRSMTESMVGVRLGIFGGVLALGAPETSGGAP